MSLRLLTFLFCSCLACPALAQTASLSDTTRATGRLIGALYAKGVIEAWGQSQARAKEPVTAEVVLALRSDSRGAIEQVEVASAPGVETELQEQMIEAVAPLTLPELPSYEGTLSFTLHQAPQRRLSPVMRGVLAGAIVGVVAFVTGRR